MPPDQPVYFQSAWIEQLLQQAFFRQRMEALENLQISQDQVRMLSHKYFDGLNLLHAGEETSGAELFQALGRQMYRMQVPVLEIMGWNRLLERWLSERQPVVESCVIRAMRQAIDLISLEYLRELSGEQLDYDLSLVSTFSYTKFYMSLLEWLENVHTHMKQVLAGERTSSAYSSLRQVQDDCSFCKLIRRADMRFLLGENDATDEFWASHQRSHLLASELFRALEERDYLLALLRYYRMQERFYTSIRKFSNFFVLYYENNRPQFQRFLEQQMQHSRSSDLCLAVLDVSDYSTIVRLWGAEAGDHLLEQIEMKVDKVLNVSSDGQLVYIRSGESFIIAYFDLPDEQVRAWHRRVLAAVDRREIRFRGSHIRFSITSAVIRIPSNRTDLLQNLPEVCAHLSHYAHEADCQNGETCWIDGPDLGQFLESFIQQQGDISYVQRAFERRAFRVFYQPIVDCTTGHIRQVEVLARIEDSQGYVSPGRYLDTIVGLGAMVTMDMMVLSCISGDLPKLRQRCSRIFVNVSPVSLRSPEFIARMCEFFVSARDQDVDVLFEITEHGLLTGMDVVEYLHRHHEIRFALDDFGIGYSSMSMVVQMAERGLLEFVKIDGSLVLGARSSIASERAIDALQYMAHGLGILTVAEWVEDDAALVQIQDLGVDYAQGFGIFHPMPIHELMAIDPERFAL